MTAWEHKICVEYVWIFESVFELFIKYVFFNIENYQRMPNKFINYILTPTKIRNL
jgi:hypothetical protein